jgi:hypothetical protein
MEGTACGGKACSAYSGAPFLCKKSAHQHAVLLHQGELHRHDARASGAAEDLLEPLLEDGEGLRWADLARPGLPLTPPLHIGRVRRAALI